VSHNDQAMTSKKPAVMCFSGLDPTGGAGIQADIETLFSTGCHCAPIITCLTVQNTQNVQSINVTNAAYIVQQARAILEDMTIECFKIGVLGDVATIEVIHTLLTDYPNIPVVLDPILVAGGGYTFGNADLAEAMRMLLVPRTTVLTPNTEELRQLAPTGDSFDACANELLDGGCQHVLLTGTHAPTPAIENRLYSLHQDPILYTWPRLEHTYHGSGCTLAAAVAGYLAHKGELIDAIQQAQRFTWEALSHGTRAGFGQHLPNRSFWNQQKF